MADFAWIGWPLALLGLVAGYVYYRLNRKVKRIDWRVILDQSLLALPDDAHLRERVTVNIGDETLAKPRAVIVEIKNTGNVGLSTASMYRPFELAVSDEAYVRTLSLARVRAGHDDPERLMATFPEEGSVIPLPPTLLNPGDWLSCFMFVDGSHGCVSVRGEAEDFAIIGRRKPSQEELYASMKRTSGAAIAATSVAVLASIVTLMMSILWGS